MLQQYHPLWHSLAYYKGKKGRKHNCSRNIDRRAEAATLFLSYIVVYAHTGFIYRKEFWRKFCLLLEFKRFVDFKKLRVLLSIRIDNNKYIAKFQNVMIYSGQIVSIPSGSISDDSPAQHCCCRSCVYTRARQWEKEALPARPACMYVIISDFHMQK